MSVIAFFAAAALAASPAVVARPAQSHVIDHSFRQEDGGQVMRLTVEIGAPQAAVWSLIGTADGWKRWAVPAAWADVRPGGMIETSYDMAAVQGAPGNIRNAVVAVTPGSLLAIRAVKAPPGFRHPAEFAQTLTIISLEPMSPTRTRVELTGAVFRNEAAFNDLYGFFLGGNASTLEALKKAAETPPPAPSPPPQPPPAS